MPDTNTTTLTEFDKGKRLKVGQGALIVIKLKENPTTGYRWAIDNVDGQVLQSERAGFDVGKGGGVGGGGERTFSFTSRQTGTATIQLKLRREWEGDRSIIDRFTVIIEVVERV